MRPIRALAALLVVVFALAASACGNATAPRPDATCDYSNGNVCR